MRTDPSNPQGNAAKILQITDLDPNLSHEMRAATGDRFETVRDVAQLLIERIDFASMRSRVNSKRIEVTNAFLTARLKAIYRTV